MLVADVADAASDCCCRRFCYQTRRLQRVSCASCLNLTHSDPVQKPDRPWVSCTASNDARLAAPSRPSSQKGSCRVVMVLECCIWVCDSSLIVILHPDSCSAQGSSPCNWVLGTEDRPFCLWSSARSLSSWLSFGSLVVTELTEPSCRTLCPPADPLRTCQS